jgi:hypothetical protein
MNYVHCQKTPGCDPLRCAPCTTLAGCQYIECHRVGALSVQVVALCAVCFKRQRHHANTANAACLSRHTYSPGAAGTCTATVAHSLRH